MTFNRSALLKDKNEKELSLTKLLSKNITEKSKLLNDIKVAQIAKTSPKSPTLFTSIAFMADLPAWILVCQKLISK